MGMGRRADEIIEELWRVKDEIAREHGYDIHRLFEYLHSVEKRTEPHRFLNIRVAFPKTETQESVRCISDGKNSDE